MATRSRHPRRALVLATVAATTATLLAVLAPAADAASQSYAIPKGVGMITVTSNGNGHGHGLSQYGAEGMAGVPGMTADKIAAFYYPGTTLTTIPASTMIRVLISNAGGNTCVQAAPGISATGVSAATIAASHALRLRLAPDTTPGAIGLMLQGNLANRCGGSWQTIAAGLPAQVDFTSPVGYVVNYHPDASYSALRGTVGAVRQGTGEITINRLGLDAYTEGVVPREMPSSWRSAAVFAQAIAARTYAEYEREHAGTRAYDICDNTQCQVYGGMTRYSKTGVVQWRDDPAAVTAYKSQVLTYQGAAAFTQYSASNGGWTVDGGQPYLVAKADPYDTRAASGDPYVGLTRSVPTATVARYFGMAAVTKIVITQRDGHGAWGGRVLSGTVTGVSATNLPMTVTTTGFGLAAALGAPENWFTITT